MTIQTVQITAAALVVALSILFSASAVATDLLVNGSFSPAAWLALAAGSFIVVAFVVAGRTIWFRYLGVSMLMSSIMLLLIVLEGQPLQTDLHMAFFAALAIVALTYDIPAILLGTALVAVHHLGLGMVFPDLVFFSGGGVGRIVLHAAILVIEAAGLIWMTSNTRQLLAGAQENAEHTQALAREMEEAQAEHLAAATDAQGQLDAISRSQAVIEFDLTGKIIAANANFCRAMGYGPDEIVGRHHSMFVTGDDAASREYADFWERLRAGKFDSAEYLRLGKGGRRVWIHATYNPIFDVSGKPYKVVKYATDVTARKAAVEAIGTALGAMAKGDLTVRIDQKFEGDLDDVRRAFNYGVEKVSELLAQLRITSSALKAATSEILSGTNDLSDRTIRQAAAVEETSAAMEQLSSTVGENTERAGAARTNAQAVATMAEESGGVMRRANEAMERITASSAKIANIIGMIDDIAFQTNLLALNASVEAARAGESGKGFAVVAVEVRRLAQSAAGASAEVKALVEQSGAEVSIGTRLVTDAAARLVTMIDGVQKSGALISSIAEASQEQANAIRQVSISMREMGAMTQHNAALVEEINATIAQTEAQAAELDQVAELFKVKGAPAASSSQEPELDERWPVRSRESLRRNGRRTEGNLALAADWNEF